MRASARFDHVTERSLCGDAAEPTRAPLSEVVLNTAVVLDAFAGSASTLAAAEAVGYHSIGVERDAAYFELGCKALPRLAALKTEP